MKQSQRCCSSESGSPRSAIRVALGSGGSTSRMWYRSPSSPNLPRTLGRRAIEFEDVTSDVGGVAGDELVDVHPVYPPVSSPTVMQRRVPAQPPHRGLGRMRYTVWRRSHRLSQPNRALVSGERCSTISRRTGVPAVGLVARRRSSGAADRRTRTGVPPHSGLGDPSTGGTTEASRSSNELCGHGESLGGP